MQSQGKSEIFRPEISSLISKAREMEWLLTRVRFSSLHRNRGLKVLPKYGLRKGEIQLLLVNIAKKISSINN